MRLFVAHMLRPDAAAAVLRLQSTNAPIRVRPAAELHLTLRFIGDVAEAAVPKIASALGGVAAATCSTSLAGLRSIDAGCAERAVVRPALPSPGLIDLKTAIDGALPADLASQTLGFYPHVTVGWLAAGHRAIDIVDAGRTLDLCIDRFDLVASQHADVDCRYRSVAQYRLRP